MKPHLKKNTATYRPFLERLGGSPVNKFVGEYGELFYDPTNPTLDSLRISDGKTKGGVKLSQSLKDSVSDIYNMIDGSKLEQIQDVINSFLEVSIENFDDLKDRVLNLEDTAVRRAGDVMTGGLKIKNDNNYKLELLPEATNRIAGTLLFSQNDATKGEIYWNPQDSGINFSFPDVTRGGDEIILQISKPAITIYTKTDIRGDLFVNDIDVLEEISKVKLELVAELLGLSIALKTKFNKEGGTIFGPVDVKPNGVNGTTLFRITETGAESIIPPVNDSSLTNKNYVDTTTVPFNLRRLSHLPE